MGAKRGPHGEGSIYRRNSDGLWIGAVSTQVDGKRQRRTVSSRSQDECLNKLRDLKNEMGVGSDDLDSIDEKINEKITGWRESARHSARRAVELYKLLGEESIDLETEFIIEASLALVYYAEALDAAYFGDLPELVDADDRFEDYIASRLRSMTPHGRGKVKVENLSPRLRAWWDKQVARDPNWGTAPRRQFRPPLWF
jgi:hypothetical protein